MQSVVLGFLYYARFLCRVKGRLNLITSKRSFLWTTVDPCEL